jgi:hypothetical protein
MSDNSDKLFAAARVARIDASRIEFGFETRLLARIRAEKQASAPWFVWAWRLAPVFAAIVVALGLWNFASSASDLDDLHATIAGGAEKPVLVTVLTGE